MSSDGGAAAGARVLWARAGGRGKEGRGDDLGRRLEDLMGGLGRSGGAGKRLAWPWVIVALAALVMLAKSVVIIGAGECGVVFSQVSGVSDAPLEPGLNLVAPFVQKVTTYDTKRTTYTMSRLAGEGEREGDDRLQALTADGQRVDLDITITYRVNPADAPKLHRAIGPTFTERIIRPQSRSVIRMVCAQHPVSDYTSAKRAEIKTEITDRLKTLFGEAYVTLEDVSVREVEFSDDFRAAVEDKQRALQEVEEMEYRIEEARSEALRLVVEAQKEAALIVQRGQELEKRPLLTQYEYVKKIAPNLGGMLISRDDVSELTAPEVGAALPSVRQVLEDVEADPQSLLDEWVQGVESAAEESGEELLSEALAEEATGESEPASASPAGEEVGR